MDFKIINIISEEYLSAIGITLFHSLWIGIILSVLTAIVVVTTRKSSSALRYQLLTGSLCLFVVAMAYLFYEAVSQGNQLASQILQPNEKLTNASASSADLTKDFLFSSKIGDLINIWSTYSTQIVLVWFLIILAKSIHLILGLNTVFYLKRNKTFDAGKIWKEKLNSLALHLGIHQQIEILQSAIAKVPMVVGHFKPVILIPLGLLNSLSMAEVEAIFCHELAHIKRRDYLVNLLQSFIEIVFFFNPAVLWLSKLIRAERENCCDDLALMHVADRRVYVKALLSCQEFQANTPDYAMALTGKNQLLDRVSRMLFNTKSTLNRIEKTVLSLAMVLVFMFVFILSNAQNKPKTKNVAKKSAHSVNSNGKTKTSSLKVKQKVNAIDDNILSEKEIALMDSAYAQAELKYAKEQARYAIEQQKMDEKEKIEDQKYKMAQDQYFRDMKQYRSDSIKYDIKSKERLPIQLKVSPVIPNPIKVDLVNPVVIDKATVPTNTTTSRKSISLTDIDENGNDLTNRVNNDLLKDGLITQTKNLSYKLDKDSLYINNIKQTSLVHAKYKAKYLKNIHAALLYNYDYTGKNII